MKRLKTSSAIFGALVGICSGIFGLFFAASQTIGTLWANFAIGLVSLCFLIAIGHLVFPWFKKKVEPITKYPRLLAAHEQALSELEALRQFKRSFPEEIEQAKRETIEEVIGNELAKSCTAELKLIAIGIADDVLYFVAEVDGLELPPLGSRYLLTMNVVNQVKGAVRIMTHEPDNRVHLTPISQCDGSEQFWERLYERAAGLEVEPPLHLELTIDESLTNIIEKGLEEQ